MVRDISALTSGAKPSGLGVGGRGLRASGIGGLVEGTGGICSRIGGTGGTSASFRNEDVNGVIRENASEILLESLHSLGDLIAMMLVAEGGPS